MADCELDHLVIAAASLERGVAFLENRLGVTVPEGGKHPLMGTHNRLMQIGTGAFLEIIAIDPDAPPPSRPRWYNLDSPALQERIATEPVLLTWVLRTDDIERDAARVSFPVGPAEEARRGDLTWKITIPEDGTMPGDGAFPTLIQWSDFKGPAATMADLGCRFEGLTILHSEPERLGAALAAIGAEDLVKLETAQADATPALTARIMTPNGSTNI